MDRETLTTASYKTTIDLNASILVFIFIIPVLESNFGKLLRRVGARIQAGCREVLIVFLNWCQESEVGQVISHVTIRWNYTGEPVGHMIIRVHSPECK